MRGPLNGLRGREGRVAAGPAVWRGGGRTVRVDAPAEFVSVRLFLLTFSTGRGESATQFGELPALRDSDEGDDEEDRRRRPERLSPELLRPERWSLSIISSRDIGAGGSSSPEGWFCPERGAGKPPLEFESPSGEDWE